MVVVVGVRVNGREISNLHNSEMSTRIEIVKYVQLDSCDETQVCCLGKY